MTVIRNSVVIRCTQEEAFDYLSDHRAIPLIKGHRPTRTKWVLPLVALGGVAAIAVLVWSRLSHHEEPDQTMHPPPSTRGTGRRHVPPGPQAAVRLLIMVRSREKAPMISGRRDSYGYGRGAVFHFWANMSVMVRTYVLVRWLSSR